MPIPSSEEGLLKKAMNSAYRQLARGPRSRIEVERRLREKRYPDPIVRRVIKTLEEYRYLDDRAFARQWARDRIARRHWGPSRLRGELQRKGIAQEWIEESLQELLSERDEETLAMELMTRRLKGRGALRHLNPRDRRRWFSYLLRRGYSVEVIQTVFRKIAKESEFVDL